MKFDLHDLQPQEAKLTLGNHSFILKKFSLAAQIWTEQRFGAGQIEGVFKNQRIPEISEIAYYLIVEKPPTLTAFQELVCTQQDKINLIQALLETVGLSQPVIEKLAKENEPGNDVRPN